MKQIFDLSTTAKRFRFVAVLEALSWLGLLIAMFFKWILDMPAGVPVAGPIHGAFFVIFILVALWTAKVLKWNLSVLFWALVSSVPPFGTLVFEWWAQRNGHLAELSPSAHADAVAAQG